jgi:hypothetical protein
MSMQSAWLVFCVMDDEDSLGATPMVIAPFMSNGFSIDTFAQPVLGNLSAPNDEQHVALRNSPPRTKRVFVLADTSRSQTKSFIPAVTSVPAPASRAAKGLASPAKPRALKKMSFGMSRVGCQVQDDATFLALLHIEPMVDRDLFRFACAGTQAKLAACSLTCCSSGHSATTSPPTAASELP